MLFLERALFNTKASQTNTTNLMLNNNLTNIKN